MEALPGTAWPSTCEKAVKMTISYNYEEVPSGCPYKLYTKVDYCSLSELIRGWGRGGGGEGEGVLEQAHVHIELLIAPLSLVPRRSGGGANAWVRG